MLIFKGLSTLENLNLPILLKRSKKIKSERVRTNIARIRGSWLKVNRKARRRRIYEINKEDKEKGRSLSENGKLKFWNFGKRYFTVI